MTTPPLSELLARFRVASCQTFNAHFLPYALTERDFEVYELVDRALFQVMVLDHLGLREGEQESIPEITFRPVRAGVQGAIQGGSGIPQAFDETAGFAFIGFINIGQPFGGDRLLDSILGERRDGSGDRVIFNWSDVVVEEPWRA